MRVPKFCKSTAVAGLAALGLAGASAAAAATCPTDPLAAAQTPTVALDSRPTDTGAARYGSIQYHTPTGLKPKQIVLSFDDGPSLNTPQVLAILDRHCIKANFFFVGFYAQAHPDQVKAAAAHGHVIGTHTWLHPLSLRRIGTVRAEREIAQGFTAVQAALADAPPQDRARLAPFFRFPGLNDSKVLIRWLGERQIAVLSADFGADDWKRISGAEVERRALKYAERNHGGILILHEARDHTLAVLDDLITQLERQGFTFAQLVPTADAHERAVQAPGALIAEGPVGPVPQALALAMDRDGPFDEPDRLQLARAELESLRLAARSTKGPTAPPQLAACAPDGKGAKPDAALAAGKTCAAPKAPRPH